MMKAAVGERAAEPFMEEEKQPQVDAVSGMQLPDGGRVSLAIDVHAAQHAELVGHVAEVRRGGNERGACRQSCARHLENLISKNSPQTSHRVRVHLLPTAPERPHRLTLQSDRCPLEDRMAFRSDPFFAAYQLSGVKSHQIGP